MKWTNKRRVQLQIPASRLIEHCQATLEVNELIFYDWMCFLVHNIMGDYLKRKKKLIFILDFSGSYTLPLTDSQTISSYYERPWVHGH